MHYLLAFFFLFTTMLAAQKAPWFTADSFESQALAYQPERRPGVTRKSFSYGQMVLRETVRQTKNDPASFNRADYLNVLSGLIALNEPKATLQLAMTKFLTSDDVCSYLTDARFQKSFLQKTPAYLCDRWLAATAACGADESVPADAAAYASEHQLDAGLITVLQQLQADDQRHRSPEYDAARQTPLDRNNEKVVDQLFEKHGTYVGKTLAGPDYKHVMWMVIQHSRLATMERYLPMLHQAVQEGELPESTLAATIDRVYVARTGKQIFGSQVGEDLHPAEKRRAVCEQYGITFAE